MSAKPRSRLRGMEFLLVHEFGREFERGAHVFGRDAVLLLDVFEAHPSSQPADDAYDGYPRAPDHGLAVLHSRVNAYPVVHGTPPISLPHGPR